MIRKNIKKNRKNTPENYEKYSRKFGKILQKIRKNPPKNQDPGVKITFSNYAGEKIKDALCSDQFTGYNLQFVSILLVLIRVAGAQVSI